MPPLIANAAAIAVILAATGHHFGSLLSELESTGLNLNQKTRA